MMIDHRLHHAARELRAVQVDVPDLLGARPAPRRVHRVPAFAAPVLFVVGGIVALSGVAADGRRPGDDFTDRDFVQLVEQPGVATARTSAVVETGTPGATGVATPFAGQTSVPANPSPAPVGAHEVSVDQELEMILSTRPTPATRLDAAAARHEPPAGPV